MEVASPVIKKSCIHHSTYEKNLDDDATYEKWAAVYASFSSGLDGSIVRSSEYWKCWVKYPAEGYSWNGDGTERCARAWEVVGEGGTFGRCLSRSQLTSPPHRWCKFLLNFLLTEVL